MYKSGQLSISSHLRYLIDDILFNILYDVLDILYIRCLGWSGGVMMLGKLSVPGSSKILESSRTRALCACSRCRLGLFGQFFSHLSLSFFFLFLGDGLIH